MKAIVLAGIGVLAVGALLVLPLPTNEVPRIWGPQKEEVKEVQVMFGGDMMFDRYIRQISERIGGDYIFSCIDHVLSKADVVVANLEGPITHNASVSAGSEVGGDNNFTFTFPIETAALLARHNIFIVNIGNNHVTNFGWEGVTQTKEELTRADVAYFGDPQSHETEKVLRISLEGVPFSFVNWSDWTSDKTDHTIAQVRTEVEAGNVTVVYAHWGDEYMPVNERQRALAHEFVKAGAALVVGSHPHVVQEVERYEDISIYYSLGNFIFDQYFSEEVTQGLLLSVTFTESGVKSIQEIPIKLHPDGRTCVADPIEK